MTTITNETLSGKQIIVTVEVYGKKNGQKYVIDYDSREDFIGAKTGKLTEAKGTPALGGTVRQPSPYDIAVHREEQVGRFYFSGQAVKGKGGVLEVNEMLRTLPSSEIIRVELVDLDKVAW